MRNKTKKQLIDEVAALTERATDNVRALQVANHQNRKMKQAAGKLRYDLSNLKLSPEDKVSVIALVDTFIDSL